jgi:hypothetical protein
MPSDACSHISLDSAMIFMQIRHGHPSVSPQLSRNFHVDSKWIVSIRDSINRLTSSNAIHHAIILLSVLPKQFRRCQHAKKQISAKHATALQFALDIWPNSCRVIDFPIRLRPEAIQGSSC